MSNCCDEYCANHGCNQGRNCPVRNGQETRKVKPYPEVPLDPEEPKQLITLMADMIIGFMWATAAIAACALLAMLIVVWVL